MVLPVKGYLDGITGDRLINELMELSPLLHALYHRLAVTIQSSRSRRGDLAALFSGALPAKYPPGIPRSLASEMHSPSHLAAPLSTELLRLRQLLAALRR